MAFLYLTLLADHHQIRLNHVILRQSNFEGEEITRQGFTRKWIDKMRQRSVQSI